MKNENNDEIVIAEEKKTFKERVNEWTDKHPKATKVIKVSVGAAVAAGGLLAAYAIGRNGDDDCCDADVDVIQENDPVEEAMETLVDSSESLENVEVTEF